jgi:hypothetical protein
MGSTNDLASFLNRALPRRCEIKRASAVVVPFMWPNDGFSLHEIAKFEPAVIVESSETRNVAIFQFIGDELRFLLTAAPDSVPKPDGSRTALGRLHSHAEAAALCEEFVLHGRRLVDLKATESDAS